MMRSCDLLHDHVVVNVFDIVVNVRSTGTVVHLQDLLPGRC